MKSYTVVEAYLERNCSIHTQDVGKKRRRRKRKKEDEKQREEKEDKTMTGS